MVDTKKPETLQADCWQRSWEVVKVTSWESEYGLAVGRLTDDTGKDTGSYPVFLFVREGREAEDESLLRERVATHPAPLEWAIVEQGEESLRQIKFCLPSHAKAQFVFLATTQGKGSGTDAD